MSTSRDLQFYEFNNVLKMDNFNFPRIIEDCSKVGYPFSNIYDTLDKYNKIVEDYNIYYHRILFLYNKKDEKIVLFIFKGKATYINGQLSALEEAISSVNQFIGKTFRVGYNKEDDNLELEHIRTFFYDTTTPPIPGYYNTLNTCTILNKDTGEEIQTYHHGSTKIEYDKYWALSQQTLTNYRVQFDKNNKYYYTSNRISSYNEQKGKYTVINENVIPVTINGQIYDSKTFDAFQNNPKLTGMMLEMLTQISFLKVIIDDNSGNFSEKEIEVMNSFINNNEQFLKEHKDLFNEYAKRYNLNVEI